MPKNAPKNAQKIVQKWPKNLPKNAPKNPKKSSQKWPKNAPPTPPFPFPRPAHSDDVTALITISFPVVRPRPPTVDVFQSCDDSGLVQLLCLIDGFAPAQVGVSWLVNGDIFDDSHAHTEPATPSEAAGTFRKVSRLNVTAAEWRDSTFSCRVTHEATGTEWEEPARSCSAPGSSPISVFILPPSPSDLYITQTPKISCLVTSLPSDQDLSITWSRPSGGGALREPLPLKLTNQYNGTFTALSQLPVTTADWEGGASFACRVGHADLPAPVERTMEKSLPPSVYLIPPPADELSGPRPTLSLTCLVRGFFPENIDVQWQKNHESLGFAQNAENFGASTAPARREKGGAGSFFLYSRLEVEREEWEKGTTFVCTVVHEGLPLRFVQRSLHRNPGN
uniref:Ig-like domain-containing protein n=1 Tax=Cyanoderma ruficeps TaxID=181631 RepID=A0A8C3R4I5_9PASS